MNKLCSLCFIILYGLNPLYLVAQKNVQNYYFSEIQKKFIASKVAKIQADYDELQYIHHTWQTDTVEYNDRFTYLNSINNIGNYCFDIKTYDKKPMDISIEKVEIDSSFKTEFEVYKCYMYNLFYLTCKLNRPAFRRVFVDSEVSSKFIIK